MDRVLLVRRELKICFPQLWNSAPVPCIQEEQERKHLGASYYTCEADCIGNQWLRNCFPTWSKSASLVLGTQRSLRIQNGIFWILVNPEFYLFTFCNVPKYMREQEFDLTILLKSSDWLFNLDAWRKKIFSTHHSGRLHISKISFIFAMDKKEIK